MNLIFHLNMMFYKIILKIIIIIIIIIKMFIKFRNISTKHLINKRFFSSNCNVNSNDLDTVKNMVKNIYIMSIINYCITLVILLR